jgi:hypothetical protein
MPSNKTCIRTSTQRAGLARTGVGGVIVGSRNTLYKKRNPQLKVPYVTAGDVIAPPSPH